MPRDRDKFRKYGSGFDKQEKKVKRDKFLDSQTGALVKFLKPIGEEVDHHDVGWRITVQWLAGNFACKVFLFLRAFGLYLSSNVLVCVSLDRYFAVLHPLRVNDARRRGKIMLAVAWGLSLLCAIPQSIVFHVSSHPKYPFFHQCVSFGLLSQKQEIAYTFFGVFAMYFLPLIVIVVAYTAIMCEIFNKSRDSREPQTNNGRMRLRRSDVTNIERARTRTLKMTIMIVVVFVWCWTPYVVMTLWYMFDWDSAAKVPTSLQDALFMMAVSNSCMNPLVYGSYAINFPKNCCRCFWCCKCQADSTINSRVVNLGVERELSSSYDLEDVAKEYEEGYVLEDGNIVPDYKRKAVEYYTTSKSHLQSLSAVEASFRKDSRRRFCIEYFGSILKIRNVTLHVKVQVLYVSKQEYDTNLNQFSSASRTTPAEGVTNMRRVQWGKGANCEYYENIVNADYSNVWRICKLNIRFGLA
ncbi:GPRGNR3 [Trypoxylus dichotomus]